MKTTGDERLYEQQRKLEQLRARVNAAKIAYLNRAPFETMSEVSYDNLKTIAQEYIRANYDYQKKRYGSIQVRVSVAKLLRH